MNRQERRTDLARRRRVDELLDRVRAARQEIVEAGLSAVQTARPAPAATTRCRER
jgi:hypothetical protein